MHVVFKKILVPAVITVGAVGIGLGLYASWFMHSVAENSEPVLGTTQRELDMFHRDYIDSQNAHGTDNQYTKR